ncbi:unnamed protein product [Lymnaea stagnalis]|uniref:cysteine--tRNA ligase n=1 Tax=Lymnaea stagnalis TaxID=6523 RepID=A0AAV2H3M6_LYMST
MLHYLSKTVDLQSPVARKVFKLCQSSWSRYKHYHQYSNCNSLANFRAFKPITAARNLHPNYSTCEDNKKWELPEGYDTGIKVYNTVSKAKVPLVLRQEKVAEWYACGPTVYDTSHIGHASCYVRQDIIRRIMQKVFNIDTVFVMGVTDIDDKIINKAAETNQTISNITQYYEAEFFASLAEFNVIPPTVVMRVTDHVSSIIDFVKDLEQKGIGYKTTDGEIESLKIWSVYFDVNQYGKYGFFSNQPDTSVVAVPEKRSPRDFALWKGHKPGEVWWQSPWGQGRPGWHVECSAMASAIFGARFDLHSGGEDLMYPHHENELAQSCVYHGSSQWVNYWIHTGHLFLSGDADKMSKSLKNVITVPELLEKYSPNQFRMLCLLSHYRRKLEFSPEHMQKAISTMSSLNSFVKHCDDYVQGKLFSSKVIPEGELFEKLDSTRKLILEALSDDFNTPQALAHLMRLVKYTNKFLEEDQTPSQMHISRSTSLIAIVGAYVRNLLQTLGLDSPKVKAEDPSLNVKLYSAVEAAVSARSKIREFAKNEPLLIAAAGEVGIPEDKAQELKKRLYKPLWQISDTVREEILMKCDVQIQDNRSGSNWSIAELKQKVKCRQGEDKDKTKEKVDIRGKDNLKPSGS